MRITTRFAAAAAVALVWLIPTGCSNGPEAAAWDREIPDGVARIEPGAVDDDARSSKPFLQQELVIGERGDDPNYILDWMLDVVADDEGNLFVLDAIASRIQVYSDDGTYLSTIGRPGPGPGELSQPGNLLLLNNELLVQNLQLGRYRRFSLSGEFLGDLAFGLSDFAQQTVGVSLRHAVGLDQLPRPDDFAKGREEGFLSQQLALTQLDLETGEHVAIHRYRPNRIPLLFEEGGGMMVELPEVHPSFAATNDGDLYATQTDEYQVYAYTLEGALRWALRVPLQAEPVTDADLEHAFDGLRELGRSLPEDARARIWRPEKRPALARIEVDGRGRLWVFHHPRTYEESESGSVRVDVYDREGRRLHAGWAPDVPWNYVRDDVVYSHHTDDSPTGEQAVARYRIEFE